MNHTKSVCNESTSLRVKRERKFYLTQGNHSNIPNKMIANFPNLFTKRNQHVDLGALLQIQLLNSKLNLAYYLI